ncbi:PGPGW domain-containing protein [Oleiharenicola lentus]|uniref:PGPGW domain-containing protein n=1 Tax=Oleiharenicola lentus TaxID=2508720 RepID=UPI003F665118
MKRGSPGSRFKNRYASAKKARKDGSWTQHIFRIVRLIVAAGALAVGVLLVFIPGPAILFFFIAGGLLASESKLVARFLDWTEVRLRAWWKWGMRHWTKIPLAGKIAVVTLAAGVAGAAAFGMYQLMAK